MYIESSPNKTIFFSSKENKETTIFYEWDIKTRSIIKTFKIKNHELYHYIIFNDKIHINHYIIIIRASDLRLYRFETYNSNIKIIGNDTNIDYIENFGEGYIHILPCKLYNVYTEKLKKMKDIRLEDLSQTPAQPNIIANGKTLYNLRTKDVTKLKYEFLSTYPSINKEQKDRFSSIINKNIPYIPKVLKNIILNFI